MFKVKIIAMDMNKCILSHYLELVKQSYNDISPEKDVK